MIADGEHTSDKRGLTGPARVPDKGDVPTGDEREPDVHLTVLDRLDGPPSVSVRAFRAVRAGLELVAAVGRLKTHAALQTRVGIEKVEGLARKMRQDS